MVLYFVARNSATKLACIFQSLVSLQIHQDSVLATHSFSLFINNLKVSASQQLELFFVFLCVLSLLSCVCFCDLQCICLKFIKFSIALKMLSSSQNWSFCNNQWAISFDQVHVSLKFVSMKIESLQAEKLQLKSVFSIFFFWFVLCLVARKLMRSRYPVT